MKLTTLYWIRLPKHTDIKTEGYVGITSHKPTTRWNHHKRDARLLQHRNDYLQNVINKYQDVLVYEIIWQGSLEGALELEYYFRDKPKIGWNISIGGQHTNLGKKHSEKTKAKLSKIAKEKEAHKSLHTPEVWNKISKAMQGSKNHQASSVTCIDTGEVFATCSEAGKAYDVSHSAISACCRKIKKQIKGKVFVYTKDLNEHISTHKSTGTG